MPARRSTCAVEEKKKEGGIWIIVFFLFSVSSLSLSLFPVARFHASLFFPSSLPSFCERRETVRVSVQEISFMSRQTFFSFLHLLFPLLLLLPCGWPTDFLTE